MQPNKALQLPSTISVSSTAALARFARQRLLPSGGWHRGVASRSARSQLSADPLDGAKFVSELFVRVADRVQGAPPVPIYCGEPPSPISCTWLAISHHPESPRAPETFVLYFLDATGSPAEALQYDSLEAALDQGSVLSSVRPSEWLHCLVRAEDNWEHLSRPSFPA